MVLVTMAQKCGFDNGGFEPILQLPGEKDLAKGSEDISLPTSNIIDEKMTYNSAWPIRESKIGVVEKNAENFEKM